MNYLAEAARRWPNARILGDGRWCVLCSDNRVVYLCLDETQQHNVALGASDPKMVDLTVRDIMDMADSIPDPDETREERQQRRAKKRVEKFNAHFRQKRW